MTKFRPHCGALDDSMRRVVDCSTLEHLVHRLQAKPTDLVEVKPCGFDDRIGWDTHLVTVNGMAVGYTDGPVPPISEEEK